PRALAEVLAAGPAIAAGAVRPPEPRDADAIALGEARRALPALDHAADHLVAGHERELRAVELAVDDVQIRPADAAGVDPHEHLARAGGGIGELRRAERRAGSLEHHGAHHPER